MDTYTLERIVDTIDYLGNRITKVIEEKQFSDEKLISAINSLNESIQQKQEPVNKFIKTSDDVFINIDKIIAIVPAGNEIIANMENNASTESIHKCASETEAAELAMELCLLIASKPAGVFIFNPEHLKSQKMLREQQQLEAANKVVEVKAIEPKRVGKVRAVRKK